MIRSSRRGDTILNAIQYELFVFSLVLLQTCSD